MAVQSQQPVASFPEQSTSFPTIDPEKLRQFHQAHFPGQQVPQVSATSQTETEHYEEDDDGLGYYEDGVKRTLTDEQIKMFRHSEIQRLLSERRQARSKKEDDQRRQRRAERRATRPHRFDDDPRQPQENFDALMYDDQPTTQQGQDIAGEKKFLWPTLGK